ncbi:MAG: hypothetical protein WC123_03585 [Bacilli bacterium]
MVNVAEYGVNEIINLIINKSYRDRYYQPQIEIINKDKMQEFLLFLETLSEETRIDELGGKSNMRRYPIDAELKDVVHMANTSIACGIKVVRNPLMSFMEYEKWDDGYIEGFARFDADKEHRFLEWFSWFYIKMNKLKIILETHKNDLFLLDSTIHYEG